MRFTSPGITKVATRATRRIRTSTPVVMLVEDDQAVRVAIVDALADLHYTVLEASSARIAMNIIDTSARIDLLVADIGLSGGLNGRQLAEAARQRRPDLMVLFITGHARNTIEGQGEALPPATELINKPFALATLVVQVQSMIGRVDAVADVEPPP